MAYRFRNGIPNHKLDANAVGDELERIRRTNGGLLTPASVVAAAKDASSPIHGWFEWNTKKAAQEYLLHQARQLIASVVIHREEGVATNVRAFVNVRRTGEENVYMPTDLALSDPVHRAALLKRALRELDSWRQRYEELEEFAKVVMAIEESRVIAS